MNNDGSNVKLQAIPSMLEQAFLSSCTALYLTHSRAVVAKWLASELARMCYLSHCVCLCRWLTLAENLHLDGLRANVFAGLQQKRILADLKNQLQKKAIDQELASLPAGTLVEILRTTHCLNCHKCQPQCTCVVPRCSSDSGHACSCGSGRFYCCTCRRYVYQYW
jgi:hypothetical protein